MSIFTDKLQAEAVGGPSSPQPAGDETTSAGPPRRLRPRTAKALVVTADCVTAVAAMVLAFFLRAWLDNVSVIRELFDESNITSDASVYLRVGAISLPGWVLVFARYRLYTARHVWDRLEELRRIVHAVTIAVAIVALISIGRGNQVARGWLLLAVPTGIACFAVERALVRKGFDRLRRHGRLSRAVVIVGVNAEAVKLQATIEARPTLGYRVVGVVDNRPPPGTEPADRGRDLVERTLGAVSSTGAIGVVIATSGIDANACKALTRAMVEDDVHVEFFASLHDIAPERLTVRAFAGHALMHVRPLNRHGWRARAKRTFDVVVAATLLALAAPVLAVAAVAIRLGSRGPVLFKQQRVGRDNKHFWMLKLRTMDHDAEERLAGLRQLNGAHGPLFKMKSDPRVNRVGKVLRRFSIDEVPQLWNVLRGEMTLVGPRPALPEELQDWSPDLHHRLKVSPGITGEWQVSGRSDSTFDDYTRLDLYYVDNWSLWRDLGILCRTVPALLSRRGAY